MSPHMISYRSTEPQQGSPGSESLLTTWTGLHWSHCQDNHAACLYYQRRSLISKLHLMLLLLLFFFTSSISSPLSRSGSENCYCASLSGPEVASGCTQEPCVVGVWKAKWFITITGLDTLFHACRMVACS